VVESYQESKTRDPKKEERVLTDNWRRSKEEQWARSSVAEARSRSKRQAPRAQRPGQSMLEYGPRPLKAG
jgi:hypothetical protein